MKGKVKFFNVEKGYGFIMANNEEYFFHVTNVDNLDVLETDDVVEFKIKNTNRGQQATHIKKIN